MKLQHRTSQPAWRHIGRKFRYYIRETQQGIWKIEDYHGEIIACFRSREDAFAAVCIFVVEDRHAALEKIMQGSIAPAKTPESVQ